VDGAPLPEQPSGHFDERVSEAGAFITRNVRSRESEDHIMRYLKSTVTRTRLISLAALLLATAQMRMRRLRGLTGA
jgi:hypothetical protein